MDLRHTASPAPFRAVEFPEVTVGRVHSCPAFAAETPAAAAEPPAVAVEPPAAAFETPSARKALFAHPDADIRIAARNREEAELNALEAEITELWGHINAATAHFLALLAEFDRREGWAQHGISSCAHWLSWQCGVGRVAAREKVRVARALASLPKVAAAFGEGRLSYSKVRALTRVATAETEDTLLHFALNGTAAQLERTVRGFRRVRRELERDEAGALHERRYLDCRRESDGSVRLEARLAPEAGEMLLKALEAAQAQLDERDGDAAEERTGNAESGAARRDGKSGHAVSARPAVSSGAQGAGVSAETPADAPPRSCRTECVVNASAETSRPRPALWQSRFAAPGGASAETPPRSASQRRADAFEHMVHRFLAGSGSRSAAGAHEVVVHIAHDALRDVPESAGAEFEHGGPVAVETARRLGCDGALVGVVEGAQGEPLAVGRRTRAVPPAIRRALRVRDGGCRFPGCDRSRFTHAHHIRHWADGGETKLDNLVTLCSQHHRLVHEGGYGVRMNAGEIEFTRPDGRVIPPAGTAHTGCFRGNTSAASGDPRAANGARRLKAFNAARGLAIDAGTARCRWGGERMDYDIAIDGLCRETGFA